MRGFHRVLQLLAEITGTQYNSYYADMKTELHKLFNKYERKFGVTRSQRVTQPSNHTGFPEESLEDEVLLVLPLPPLHLLLPLQLLNFHAI
jgi:hypothetical protein